MCSNRAIASSFDPTSSTVTGIPGRPWPRFCGSIRRRRSSARRHRSCMNGLNSHPKSAHQGRPHHDKHRDPRHRRPYHRPVPDRHNFGRCAAVASTRRHADLHWHAEPPGLLGQLNTATPVTLVSTKIHDGLLSLDSNRRLRQRLRSATASAPTAGLLRCRCAEA